MKKIALLALTFLLFPLLAKADELFEQLSKSPTPIDIKAETLVVKTKENKAIFKDNVVVKRENLTLHSEKMMVFYNDEITRKTSGNTISRIVAEKDVKLESPTKNATSDLGEYNINSDKVTLIGNVVLEEGGNSIKGQKFIYDVKTGVSEMFNNIQPSPDNDKASSYTPENNDDSKENDVPESSGRVKGVLMPESH